MDETRPEGIGAPSIPDPARAGSETDLTAGDPADAPSISDPADERITAEAEAFVRELQELWLAPRERECLVCYLDRTLRHVGCANDLRLAGRYRDLVAPRAFALERRLADSGGFCDCEVMMNAYEPSWRLWTPAWEEELPDGGAIVHEADYPKEMPRCAGVRRGSTRGCTNWQVRRRYR